MAKTYPYLIGAGLALAVMAVFSFSSKTTITEEAPKKQHRIVFQMTTPDTVAYRALTRQLNNILTEWPEAQIEVVAHNKGIGLLDSKKCNVPSELEDLKKRGVQFVACEQTLKQQKIDKSQILPFAGFVERGIVEIVTKQEMNWSYIKGGF